MAVAGVGKREVAPAFLVAERMFNTLVKLGIAAYLLAWALSCECHAHQAVPSPLNPRPRQTAPCDQASAPALRSPVHLWEGQR